ncbi:MAG: hypothetical protein VYE68_02920 [Acidobacteriota bacterium]|nr:hypothetical protein [Acidobacteriota bacterium]
MSSMCVDVTIPCETRLLPVLRELTERAVVYLGFHPDERDALMQSIHQALYSVFESDDITYAGVELQLASTADVLRLRIRYLGAVVGVEGQPVIEQILAQPDADGVPIERLRGAVGTVTFGREAGADGADFCELTVPLPEE